MNDVVAAQELAATERVRPSMPLWGQAESLRLTEASLQKLSLELLTTLDADRHAELRHRLHCFSQVAALHLQGAAERLDRKGAAEDRARKVYESKLDRLHAANLNEAGFAVRGFCVYFLWSSDTDRPLYIGQSTNVLSRLGSHLGDREKRARVERVTILRLSTRRGMDTEERRLIRLHRPPWNLAGVPSCTA